MSRLQSYLIISISLFCVIIFEIVVFHHYILLLGLGQVETFCPNQWTGSGRVGSGVWWVGSRKMNLWTTLPCICGQYSLLYTVYILSAKYESNSVVQNYLFVLVFRTFYSNSAKFIRNYYDLLIPYEAIKIMLSFIKHAL